MPVGSQFQGDSQADRSVPHDRRETVTSDWLAANSKPLLCGGPCTAGERNSGARGRQGGRMKACEKTKQNKAKTDKSIEPAVKALTVDTKVGMTLILRKCPWH